MMAAEGEERCVTTRASMEAVTAFWAAHLGCSRAQLTQPGTTVVANGPDLADYRGATVVAHPPACVVAVPPDWYEPAVAGLGHRPPAAVFDEAVLRRVFGDAVRRVVGPAWLGYADAGDFRPAPTMGARLLTDQDLAALRGLAAACGPTEWEHGGIDPACPPVYGCHAGEVLAAAGKAVVSAMTADGLAAGGVVQYRTLQANLPSVGIARALGFQRFALTLAVRLTPPR
jgi:hypothetical protein